MLKDTSLKILGQVLVQNSGSLRYLSFSFNGGDTKLTNEGLIDLSKGLIKCINLETFLLEFSWGNASFDDETSNHFIKSIPSE